jgi:hypothetical protein
MTIQQLGNCIGRGQFGSVYRSLNLGTGQMMAIKRIRLHGMREDEVKDVMREVELLKRLSHPSIVKYEGMSRDEDYLNIVLEWVKHMFSVMTTNAEQVRGEWKSWSNTQGIWTVQREASVFLCGKNTRRFTLPTFSRCECGQLGPYS